MEDGAKESTLLLASSLALKKENPHWEDPVKLSTCFIGTIIINNQLSKPYFVGPPVGGGGVVMVTLAKLVL